MEYKDYYALLNVERNATQDQIKLSYRKLARKYHPDVSHEPDAEAKFKEVAEAYKALSNPERRAAYDDVGNRYGQGQAFNPPPDWASGFEFSGRDFDAGDTFGNSDFFESLFGKQRTGMHGARATGDIRGGDHHAKIEISLRDAYQGGRRTITLHVPDRDSTGQLHMKDKQLEVMIPKGIQHGQNLRLSGQGAPGYGAGSNGDLYLEIDIAVDPRFRVDGLDIYTDMPVSPWEAMLGANVVVNTPDSVVQLAVPSGSVSGRKLRLKGKGLPGTPPGDLYVTLAIALPPAKTPADEEAYRGMAKAFVNFNPRQTLET